MKRRTEKVMGSRRRPGCLGREQPGVCVCVCVCVYVSVVQIHVPLGRCCESLFDCEQQLGAWTEHVPRW